MWIQTVKQKLLNLDRSEIIAFDHQSDGTYLMSFATEGQSVIAIGAKEDMQAILDRIARAIAAGLPFLDLGKTEEQK